MMATVRWSGNQAQRLAQAWTMTQVRELKVGKWYRATGSTETSTSRRFGPFLCHVSQVVASSTGVQWHVGWYVGTTCLVFAMFPSIDEAKENALSILHAFLIQAQGELDETGEVD